jgi:hypothetical protein
VWDHPEPLETILLPYGIDWTLQGLRSEVLEMLESGPETVFDVHLLEHRESMDALIEHGVLAEQFRNEKVMLASGEEGWSLQH